MGKPLKTLFLLEDLCFGGTQAQTLELAARLDREKFELVMLTLTGPTDLDVKAEAAGIQVLHMGQSRKAAPLFFLKLGKELDRIKPDIIVPCTALPNIWGRIWGRLKKTPLIIGTVRGGGAPVRQHEKWLWRMADGIVCNTRPLTRVMRYLGAAEEKLAYIPNGVDKERFKPSLKKYSGEAALILCVARLAKDKDHKTLLKAFASVSEHYPEARLRLVGEGPEEAPLKHFVEKELAPEIGGRIEFAGPSDAPEKHYAEADIFCLASQREGMPNAILEAMSCGLPICATDVGGIPDLLEGSGLISQAGYVEGLADNLLTYIRAPRMAVHMGAMGRVKVESEYSYEAMVKAHEDYFLKLWQDRRN